MSAPASGLAGAVLAGGESRRMGRDKAQLEVDGITLLHRQLEVLRACGAAPLVVSCGKTSREVPAGVANLPDRFPGTGPMAGIHAALEALRAPHVAVLAVDMPRIDAVWFTWLRTFCRPAIGAIARHPDGYFEPLAAIYPREILPEIDARLRRGDFAMQALATTLVAANLLVSVPLAENQRSRTTNWNTPTDLGGSEG